MAEKKSFRALNTRSKSNEGIKVSLKDTDDKPTEDWLRVRGIDSDVFQHENRRMRANVLGYLEKHGLAAKDTPEYVDFTLSEQRKLQACLVSEWSFEEPCTSENVNALFLDAPYIAAQVDEAASKRSQFVGV